MPYFPLFLDLGAKRVLVVGAGPVGRRKIASLLKAKPLELRVADPFLASGEGRAVLRELNEAGVVCLARGFLPDDLDGMSLVFAASGDRELNATVAELCATRGILCNCAAPPEAGDCIVPAHFSEQALCVAVGTSGHSPALAKRLRMELEAFVASRYSPLLLVMGRLRPLLLSLAAPTGENTALFRTLIDSSLADSLERGDREAARQTLLRHLPEPLHSHVGDLLHGL